MNTVKTTLMFAASALLLMNASPALAHMEGCRTDALDVMRCDAASHVDREQVVAELREAQRHGELAIVGELSEAPEADEASHAEPLTREEVLAVIEKARAEGTLPHGELN